MFIAHGAGTGGPNCCQWCKCLLHCARPTPSEETHECEPSSSIFVQAKKIGKHGSQLDHTIVLFFLVCAVYMVSQKRRTQRAGNVTRDLHWASSNHRRTQGWEWALESQAKGRVVIDRLPISWPLVAHMGIREEIWNECVLRWRMSKIWPGRGIKKSGQD